MPPTNPHVLYVEDHIDTIELVTLLLGEVGFNVTSRSTVRAALEVIAQQKFDLYLLDSWLPDGSGLDLCKKIREADPHTPIVFYSAAAYASDHEEALKHGAHAYLIKPTDSLELAERLTKLVGNGKDSDGDRDGKNKG
jgi:two-component system response regulator PilR (NtrC family)